MQPQKAASMHGGKAPPTATSSRVSVESQTQSRMKIPDGGKAPPTATSSRVSVKSRAQSRTKIPDGGKASPKATRSRVSVKSRAQSRTKIPDGRKEPPKATRLSGIKQFLARRSVQLTALLIVLFPLLVALLYVLLYFLEIRRREEEYRQAQKIHQTMIKYDEFFKDANDTEAMFGVTVLMEELNYQLQKSERLRRALDLVVEKLKENWKAFHWNLYYFDTRKLNFDSAAKNCERQGASLVEVEKPEEEVFLENEVYRRTKNTDEYFWIGLRAEADWRWINGDALDPAVTFWDDGMPKKTQESCAFISRCRTKTKCWRDAECVARTRWICKIKFDPSL